MSSHGKILAPGTAMVCAGMILIAGCGGGGGNGSGSGGRSNQPPVASAGLDQTVLENALVTLSAAGSSDTDGRIVEFTWRQTSGPSVALIGASESKATFSAPLTNAPRTLSFEVTVWDGVGASDRAATMITVNPSEPPTANAGPDQTVVETQDVALSASDSSDRDGSIATYSWVQTGGPTVSLSDPAVAGPTFSAPPTDKPVAVSFEVRVTDNTDDASTDSVTATVLPNAPPQFAVAFPCDGCRSWGKSITVTGVAISGDDLPEVVRVDTVAITVDAGAGSVSATVFADGVWVARNVPVDQRLKTLNIAISATDAFGDWATSTLSLEQRPTVTGGILATHPMRAHIVYLLDNHYPLERTMELDTASGDIRVIHEVRSTFDSNARGPFVVDATNDRLLWHDYRADSIVSTDISTGTLVTVSGNGIGNGPGFSSISDIAFDDTGQRLIVTDRELDAVFSVDLPSGNRTKLADNSGLGTGPALNEPTSIAVDPFTGQMYVEQYPGNVMVIDADTGNRATVSTSQPLPNVIHSMDFDLPRNKLVLWAAWDDTLISLEPESGLVAPISIAGASGIEFSSGQARIDVPGNRYLLVHDEMDAVVGIDPITGAREFLYRDVVGSGPRIEDTSNVAVDPFSNQGYVLAPNRLWGIDLANGSRSLIAGPERGSGDPFVSSRDIALDLKRGLAYVLDRRPGADVVIAVDLKTGDRRLISGPLFGTGPEMPGVTAMTFDQAAGRLLVTDDTLDAVLSIDLTTGNRFILSAGADGVEPFQSPVAIDLDVAGHRLIVTDEGDGGTVSFRIFGVNPKTGARTVLNRPGSGLDFTHQLNDVAVLPGSQLILVSTGDSLTLIDLESGARAVIAGGAVGSGENVRDIRQVALDPHRAVMYTWSHTFGGLFQFDLFSGDRVLMSK